MKAKALNFYLIARFKKQNKTELISRYMSTCLNAIATAQPTQIKPLEELLGLLDGNAEEDDRTADQIIEDTKQLFKGGF